MASRRNAQASGSAPLWWKSPLLPAWITAFVVLVPGLIGGVVACTNIRNDVQDVEKSVQSIEQRLNRLERDISDIKEDVGFLRGQQSGASDRPGSSGGSGGPGGGSGAPQQAQILTVYFTRNQTPFSTFTQGVGWTGAGVTLARELARHLGTPVEFAPLDQLDPDPNDANVVVFGDFFREATSAVPKGCGSVPFEPYLSAFTAPSNVKPYAIAVPPGSVATGLVSDLDRAMAEIPPDRLRSIAELFEP
ncbi:MAG: hypothetical protein ACRDQ2_11195 [Gaiellales bacterium]